MEEDIIKKMCDEQLTKREKILIKFLRENGFEVSDKPTLFEISDLSKKLKRQGKILDVITYIESDFNNYKFIECYIPFFNSLSNPIDEETKQKIGREYMEKCLDDKKKKEEKRKNQLDCFLIELAELSERFNIYIGGCGCCDSPYLYGDNVDRHGTGNLTYDSEKKEYFVS